MNGRPTELKQEKHGLLSFGLGLRDGLKFDGEVDLNRSEDDAVGGGSHLKMLGAVKCGDDVLREFERAAFGDSQNGHG